jgi:hypothetical protein
MLHVTARKFDQNSHQLSGIQISDGSRTGKELRRDKVPQAVEQVGECEAAQETGDLAGS